MPSIENVSSENASSKDLSAQQILSKPWHALDKEQALAVLGADASIGLTAAAADARLNQYGVNEIVEAAGRSRWQILLDQFADVMLLMLMGVAVVAAVLDVRAGAFPKDAIAIMTIVLINAVLGYLQESKAEQALAALKVLSAPEVRVIREGSPQQIAAKALVPGDILLLEAGDQVAADGRLLEAATLQIRESALTGEAIAVGKKATKQ